LEEGREVGALEGLSVGALEGLSVGEGFKGTGCGDWVWNDQNKVYIII
jgi:hypothetical protein